MQTVIYVPDGADCTIENYPQNPEKYRGNIACDTCEEGAWFVKGFSTDKYIRTPCFAAHHKEDCGNKITLIPDEDGDVDASDPGTINVDLDKHRTQSIDVGGTLVDSGKESRWGTTKKYSGAGEYPENKSLRQILTRLSQNPGYPDDDVTVKMTADGGRIVLQGALAENLISQGEIPNAPLGVPRVFWGRINNVNRRDGVLWLNCGSYKTEPSVVIDDADLEGDLMKDFRLNDVDDLQGADFIVVGWLSKTKNGKPFIKFGFSKYIAFRKYTVVLEE